jgi:hypothetical protein
MTSLDTIKAAIVDVQKTMDRYSKFGATDSEPDGKFQWLLVRTIRGKSVTVPGTADGWNLYDDMPGANRAAGAIAKKVQVVVDRILATPIGEAKEVETYLKNYCWRINYGWYD